MNNKLLDVYGLFISNENLRHIQSFFIFLNNKSPNFKKIINFWLKYYPFSSRFFCIKFGELGFSKFLKKNHIFYDAFITPKSFHEFNDSRKYFFPKITVDNNFSPNNLSPSHILGFSIFFKFGYFIVKKDIVSKRIYSRNHLAMILKRNHLEFLFNEFHPDNTSLIFKLKKFFLIV